MKSILVPIDFSKDSINALDYAINIAKKISANIRMVYVKKEENFYPEFYQDFGSIKLKTAKDYLEILLKEKQTPQLQIDYKIREGHIYKEIVNQAKYDDDSMIIMGTHGVSGFEEFWIGSNAYRVVTNAPCPVITIRYGYTKNDIKKIVLPIDYTFHSRQKVPTVADFAAILGAEVHVIAVHETDTEDVVTKAKLYAQQTYDYLSEKNIHCKLETIGGEEIENLTVKYAQKIDAGLISIIATQKERSKTLFFDTYAQRMVNHSPLPVMTVRLSNILKDEV